MSYRKLRVNCCRKLRHLAPAMRDRVIARKRWKGIALIENWIPDAAAVDRTERQLPAAAFFTKTHFEIFGLFFPRALPDLPSAVSHVSDLYLYVNITMKFHRSFDAVRKQRGAAASWPQVWQQELDTLTRLVHVQCL